MSARLELKIFLSSPGDVSDERGLARRVLDRLSQEYGLRDRVHLEEVSWDDPGAPVPLDAHLTPQEAINKRRHKPSQCDVVIVILWSRMGTPLPPKYRKRDGTPYVSGTEYEFCDAMDAGKQTSKPTVLVYRRTEEPRVGLDDPEHDEKAQQYKAVKAFFANFKNTDGSLRQSYNTYRLLSEFEDLLERELRELIQAELAALPKDETPPAKNEGSSAEREGKQPAADTTKPDDGTVSQELERYRQTAVSMHSALPLAGFKTKLRVPIDLEELYVPLQAHVDLRATGEADFADAVEAEERLKSAQARSTSPSSMPFAKRPSASAGGW